MAITTLAGHVSRAYDFFHKSDIYFGFGKSSVWSESDRTTATPTKVQVGENYPPVPTPLDTLKEPIAFKKVESINYVIPDENGSIIYRDTKWSIVDEGDIYKKGAKWVALTVSLAYGEIPVGVSYRQIGCFTGLVKAQGVSASKFTLLPTEVDSQGVLEVLDNRRAINRAVDQRERLVLIIEF